MVRPRRFRLALLAFALAAASGSVARAGVPDWASVADVGAVQVVTRDEDGDLRETTVWLIVLDGRGYIRTGGTRWGANLVRDPEAVLRIDETEYPMRVEFVEDDGTREQVVAAFREKYGFSDAFISVFRGSRPKIMRLLPR